GHDRVWWFQWCGRLAAQGGRGRGLLRGHGVFEPVLQADPTARSYPQGEILSAARPRTTPPSPRKTQMPRTRTTARQPLARARAAIAAAFLAVGGRLKRILRNTAGSGPTFDLPLTQMTHMPVVAYFADSPATIYQIKQWLPVFEQV